MGPLLGDRAMLDAPRDDQELSFLQPDLTVTELHNEASLHDQEEFVLVIVVVPDELAPELDELDVLAVHLTNDLGAPVILEEGQLLVNDLYRRAMHRCGADAGLIGRLVEKVRSGRSVRLAIEVVGLPDPVCRFLGETLEVIEGGEVYGIASAFTFGREGLLPDVFRRIVEELGTTPGATLDVFRDYHGRHIELDDGEHGPMAEKLVAELCGGDPARWRAAEGAAVRSLEARLHLWDGIVERITARS